VQIALAEARTELASKDDQIARIKKNIEKGAELIEAHGYFYDQKDSKPDGRSYCPRCWAKDKELMRLAETGGTRGTCKCPECNAVYHNVPDYSSW